MCIYIYIYIYITYTYTYVYMYILHTRMPDHRAGARCPAAACNNTSARAKCIIT